MIAICGQNIVIIGKKETKRHFLDFNVKIKHLPDIFFGFCFLIHVIEQKCNMNQ